MDLTVVQIERLQRSANIAANAGWEGDVSGLAFALIRYAGLDVDNGYFVSSENHINDHDHRRMDIVVEVLLGRRRVLVIECKKDTTHPTRDRQQLFGYMQDGGFPNGMMMYPRHTAIYSLDVNAEDAEVEFVRQLNNITEVQDILENMFHMRLLDEE